MTVPISSNRVQYDGNGSQTSFPYTFRIFDTADLVVILTSALGVDTTWTLNTQYTVTGADLVGGGNVVVKTTPVDYTPAAGTKLTIYREVDITQESDYVENAPFHADTLEDDLDKGIMIDQQLNEYFGRSIVAPVTDDAPALELPNAETRANMFLVFDANGDVDVTTIATADLIDPGTVNDIVVYVDTDRVGPSIATVAAGVITDGAGGTSTQWDTAYGWGDHAAGGYVKANGSVPFTSTQTGVTPTTSGHIATKGYVDTQVSTLSGSIVLDHGALTGLADDDHSQYHNDTRGDIRYYTQTQLNAGQLDTRYYTETEVGVISGALNTKLDTHKSSTDHDGRYYTESEVDVISGAINGKFASYLTTAQFTTSSGDIVNQIPSLAGYATTIQLTTTSGDIVNQIPTDYISDSEMTVISGDIINQIPSLAGYLTTAQFTTSSGDIVNQIPSDYISDSEMTTISGDIVNQIPSLAGYLTTAQFTTSSGDIVNQIPSDYVSDAEMITISGDIVAQIGAGDFIGLTDTPSSYVGEQNKYVRVNGTADGLIFATISGGEGTDHSVLANLDYSNSGHTGFVSTAQLTTTSGDIVGQIPSLAGYATTAQLTTTSGDIVDQIPSDYITDVEMTVISGDIVAQIPSLAGYATDAEVTVISGDIIAQIPSDYISDSEMTTISGDIVAQIPSLAGYATTVYADTISGALDGKITAHKSSADHDSRYYTETEVDTISGALNTKISAKISSVSADTNPSLGGNLAIGNYTVSGTDSAIMVTGDHGTSTLPQVVNVVYGTGSAPTANTTTIGTLYIKYTA
jgi:hypothetical protein